jgi:hypothetical protein
MWRTHLLLLGGLLGVYALTSLLVRHAIYPQLPPRLYPQLPPLAVTLFMFRDANGLLGALLHGAAFSILNFPLLIVPAPDAKILFFASLAAFTLLIALSMWFWGTSVGYGLRYQGLAYVLVYAAANAIALLLLAAAAIYLWDTYGVDPVALRKSLIWFNASLYLALLLVSFPYFGEVP